VGSVKSDLLFELLQRLRDARMSLVRSQLVRTLPTPPENDEGTG
jgi:hypothetical protein